MSLEHHLHQATAVGQLDSEGVFTIAGAAAIGKLASFQLPRGSAWVLKIVQAAVVAQAKELRVSQGKNSTTFVFRPSENLCGQTMGDALTQVQAPEDLVIAHLVVGLRTVGFGETRAFAVELEGAGERHFLAWNGEELTRSMDRTQSDDCSVTITVDNSPSGQPEYLRDMTAKHKMELEYRELVRHGEVCPIPLFVDGRRLDTVSAVRNLVGYGGKTAVLSVGWHAGNEDQDVKLLKLPTGLIAMSKRWRFTDKFDDERILALDGDKDRNEAGCLVKIAYHYEILSYENESTSFKFENRPGPSEVCWVKDGVICHRETLPVESSPLTYSLYLSADDLKTDISGFKLLTDSRVEERIEWAQAQVAGQASRTLEALARHRPQAFKEHTFALGFFGFLAILAPGALLVKGLAGAFLWVSAKLMAQDKAEIVADALGHLKQLAQADSAVSS